MSSMLKAGRTGSVDVPAGLEEVPRVRGLDEIVALQDEAGPLYLRFSPGPVFDTRTGSRDRESGCDMPGLAVRPLTAEAWWDRPEEHWIARQVCQYTHLWVRPRYTGWLLTGDIVGRGSDGEPLIAGARAVALVTQDCVEQAASIYEKAFPAGRL